VLVIRFFIFVGTFQLLQGENKNHHRRKAESAGQSMLHLEKEFGEHIVEKRGWHWALTSFTVEVWGSTEIE